MEFKFFNQLPRDLQLLILSENPNNLYRSAFLNRELNTLTQTNRQLAMCSKSLKPKDYYSFFSSLPERFSIFHIWHFPESSWNVFKFEKINKVTYDSIFLSSFETVRGQTILKPHSYFLSIYDLANITGNYTFDYKNFNDLSLDIFSQYEILLNNVSCSAIAKQIIVDRFKQNVNDYINNDEFLYAYLLSNSSISTIEQLDHNKIKQDISLRKQIINRLYDEIINQINLL